MDITIQRDHLVKELALAASVTSKKPTIPIYGSVLLHANGDGLRLSATDTEIGVNGPCEATIAIHGAMAVPVTRLFDLVRSFPDAPVRLVADQKGVGVTSGAFKGRIQTLPADDFTALPAPVGSLQTLLPAELFRDLILRTRYAVTEDDKRYFLAGAYMEVEPGLVRLVGTDAKRLAIAEARDGRLVDPKVEPVIIPKKTLDALAQILDGTDEDVAFGRGEQHLFFKVGGHLLISRTIDGKFPVYRGIVPKSYASSIEIDRAALLTVLRRSLLMSETSSRRVEFSLEPGALFVKSKSADVGDAEESVAVDYAGQSIGFKVNGDYVADFLEAAGTEKVAMRLNSATTAVGFEAVESDVPYRYVVMPQIG